jgi:hypothetical protein
MSFGIKTSKGLRRSLVGKRGPDVGLADEAEEFFPAAGDYEAEKFGV